MPQKVVVVGFCASGKSSVVEALRARGVDAHAVAQEHSGVEDLWNHPEPDIVLFLDVLLEDIRKRRENPDWPEWIFELQRARLASARERANLVGNSSELTISEIVLGVLELLDQPASSSDSA